MTYWAAAWIAAEFLGGAPGIAVTVSILALLGNCATSAYFFGRLVQRVVVLEKASDDYEKRLRRAGA